MVASFYGRPEDFTYPAVAFGVAVLERARKERVLFRNRRPSTANWRPAGLKPPGQKRPRKHSASMFEQEAEIDAFNESL